MTKSNAEYAADNYLLWLNHYPSDFEGATAAASDFIDNEADLDELIAILRNFKEIGKLQ